MTGPDSLPLCKGLGGGFSGVETVITRSLDKRDLDPRYIEEPATPTAAGVENRGKVRCHLSRGAAAKGTWVRLLDPPVEGRLVHGFEGIDVGHRVRVQLTHTDVEQGFIDFQRDD